MRIAVIGLGIQGRKRLAIAGDDLALTVDPVAPDAQFKTVEDAPLDRFDAALVCTPDQGKLPLLNYLLSHGKHVLVEKPLLAAQDEQIRQLAETAWNNDAACYTAYNHRFEPYLVKMKEALRSGTLGEIYLIRMFYGNGTAMDVKQSPWRNEGSGALQDLGSHLLDMVHFFLDGPDLNLQAWSMDRLENQSLDHVLFGVSGKPAIEMEATYLSWKNTFSLDVIAEKGSAHVSGLCKWGPSTFAVRTRTLPSGVPQEESEVLECPDPTWELEYDHFKRMCQGRETNLENDLWINSALRRITESASAPLSL
jgi:predicted dehydrogenase